METRAIAKYVRISPFKAREVARLIQGKPAPEALALVDLIPRKAARLIGKTLRSAVANAENDEYNAVSADNLIVKEAVVGEGPTLKRWRPKARGMAGRIRKRTSHIRIVVTDQE
jgi:large subunit ribosomal protein L22